MKKKYQPTKILQSKKKKKKTDNKIIIIKLDDLTLFANSMNVFLSDSFVHSIMQTDNNWVICMNNHFAIKRSKKYNAI